MSLDVGNLGNVLKGLQDDFLPAINYEHNKRVAIGTGIAAIVALVALVALAIIFPPLSLAFLIGTGLAGAAFLALGTTSIIHGVWAVQGYSMLNNPINSAASIAKKHFGIDIKDYL